MEVILRFYEFTCDGCDGVAVRSSRHVASGPIFCSRCSERETPLCYMCGGPRTNAAEHDLYCCECLFDDSDESSSNFGPLLCDCQTRLGVDGDIVNEPCPSCRESSDDADDEDSDDEDSDESGGVFLPHESSLRCCCRLSLTPCEHCLDPEDSDDEESDNEVPDYERPLRCGLFEWEHDPYVKEFALHSQFEELEDLELELHFEAGLVLQII